MSRPASFTSSIASLRARSVAYETSTVSRVTVLRSTAARFAGFARMARKTLAGFDFAIGCDEASDGELPARFTSAIACTSSRTLSRAIMDGLALPGILSTTYRRTATVVPCF